MNGCVLVGKDAERGVAGPDRIVDGPGGIRGVSGLAVVEGERRKVGAEIAGVDRLDRLGRPTVEALTTRQAQAFVETLADHGVREPVGRMALPGGGRLDELCLQGCFEGEEEVVLVEPGHVREHGEVELGAHHRRPGQHVPSRLREPGEAPVDERPDALRDRQRFDRDLVKLPAAAFPEGSPRFQHVPDDLFEEVGVPFGLSIEGRRQRLFRGLQRAAR